MNVKFNPANEIQDFLVFGEFGDVNPSIGDSSTYTFLNASNMEEAFNNEDSEDFFYSRHWNPTNKYLAKVLALMEGGQSAQVMSSGMAAISCSLLTLCQSGDEIIASPTLYGGTFALLNNLLPKYSIKTKFVNTFDIQAIEEACNSNTKVLYIESIDNPLLNVADIPTLARLCKKLNIKLVVDNTFSPMIISPLKLGADIVVYSMTKFINGTSDCMAGAVISNREFIFKLTNVLDGPSMLFGPALDSGRSASILKNMHSLHIRMVQHGKNALYLAKKFESSGFKVYYPGLVNHPQHQLLSNISNQNYGYGGIFSVDLLKKETANRFMLKMQDVGVGYFAVSLGFFKTLFCAPSHSTSSEIPDDIRKHMGLSEGLIRFSVGIDSDILRSWKKIEKIINNNI